MPSYILTLLPSKKYRLLLPSNAIDVTFEIPFFDNVSTKYGFGVGVTVGSDVIVTIGSDIGVAVGAIVGVAVGFGARVADVTSITLLSLQ